MAKGNTIAISVLFDNKNLKSGLKDTEGVLGKLGGLAGGVVKTVGAIGGSIAALALAGGFARALNIDEAKTKLGALGYAGQKLDSVMKSALDSVKGTSFGLGDAATVAANALAAGVPAGESLTSQLKIVTNTAALAGVSLGEMGSIFTKVWANGKVTTQEMNQLADRGVPIWQILSKAFGVTNEELRKMIEAGQVTADMFTGALGPAVDGMATTMGGSFKGMLANTMAALSRLGALFASPILEGGKAFLAEATVLIDGLGTMLKPVADRFAEFLQSINLEGAGQGVLNFLQSAVAAIPGLVELVTQFSPLVLLAKALEPILPPLGAALSALAQAIGSGLVTILPDLLPLLSSLINLLALVLPPVVSLATVLVQAATNVVNFVVANRELVTGIAIVVGSFAGLIAAINLAKAVQLAFVAVTYGAQGAMIVAGTAAKIYGTIMTVWGNVTKIATAVQAAFNLVMSANPIGIVITAIAALVAGLIYFFTQTELGQQVWANFTKFLTEAWTNISNFAVTVWTAIADFFTQLWTTISKVFTDAWNGIVSFLTPIFEFIAALVRTYIEIWVNIFLVFAAVLKTVWDAIASVVTTVWQAIVDFLTPIITWLVDNITAGVNTIQGVWNAVWGAISSFFTDSWNSLVAFLVPIVARVISAVSDGVNTIQGVWNAVWGAISSFFTSIWQSIVNGVTGPVSQVLRTVFSIRDSIFGFFSGVGNWLYSMGRNLIEGFINGIVGMAQRVIRAIGDVVNGAIDWAKNVLGIHSPSRVFAQIGDYLGQGLAKGIAGSESRVERAMSSLTATVQDNFTPKLSITAADLQANASGTFTLSPDDLKGLSASSTATAPVTYEIHVHTLNATAETGRVIKDALNTYELAGGRR